MILPKRTETEKRRRLGPSDIAGSGDRQVLSSLLAGFTVSAIVLKLAWMADDASITSRVIANLLSGHGPNFNLGERAQAFTHPLWLLLTSGLSLLTNDIQTTMMLTGVLCAGLSAWLLARNGVAAALIVVGAFSLSFTLAEFGASGLENSLSWLLVLLMWVGAKQQKPWMAFVAGSLAMATRLDLAVVVIPFLFLWNRRATPTRRLAQLTLAALPAAAWAAFSWGYYGSPLPETYFAKVNSEIPAFEMIGQGIYYLYDLARYDVVSMVIILAGVHIALQRTTSRESKLLVLCGVGFYSSYVIWVGGDFMSGRFWSIPIICGLAAAAEHASRLGLSSMFARSGWRYSFILPPLALLLLVPIGSVPIVRSPLDPPARANAHGSDNRGIVDEWSFYLDDGRGLLQSWTGHSATLAQLGEDLESWPTSAQAVEIRVQCGNVGRAGLEAGPTVHYVVNCGLSDPFLARIAFDPGTQPWRIGHFVRDIPPGYLEALASGHGDGLQPEYLDLFEATTAARRIPLKWSSEVMIP